MASQEPLLHSEDEEDLVFDRTGLLNPKHKSGITLTDLRHKGSRFHIARTVNLCFSFFALGLCFALPTATLEDLRKAVSADSWSIEYIYTARYSGYVLGALIGGVLFDRYNRQFLLFLSLLCTGVGVVVMPFCNALGTLMACTAVTGITMGFLDTGGNVWCLDLWGKSSAPVMQALHFFFALGAFVAPLVAEPFLSPNSSVEPFINHSLYHNNASEIKFPPQIAFPHGALHSGPPFHPKERSRRDTDLNNLTLNISSSLTSPNFLSTTTMNPSKPKKPAFADGNQLHRDTTWDRKSLHNNPSNKPHIEIAPTPTVSKFQNFSNHDDLNSTDNLDNKNGRVMPTVIINTSIEITSMPSSKPLISTIQPSNLSTSKANISSATTVSTLSDSHHNQVDSFKTPFPVNNNLNETKLESKNIFKPSMVVNSTSMYTTSELDNLLNDMANDSAINSTIVIQTNIVKQEKNSFVTPSIKPVLNVLNSASNKSRQHYFEATKETLASYPKVVSSTKASVSRNDNEDIKTTRLSSPPLPVTISLEDDNLIDIGENPPPLNEQDNEESADEMESSNTKKPENNATKSQDFLGHLFDTMHQKRLGRFEFAYVILSVYLFALSIVFLIFLCLNPRESRSRQEEELDKTHFITSSSKISLVGLMSLFFCLYVGIQVSVGQLLQTFVTKQQVQPSRPTGYFLTYMFWGSFAMSRGFAVGIATRVSNVTILVANLTVCLLASIMLVAGANKVEGLLWAGIVILAVGMAPVFPAALSWVEHYLPVSNKIASLFILGAALGEMALPLLIERSMTRDPMVLMYVNIGVNALCFITFGALWLLASRQGSKYKQKPCRTLYQLASAADELDDSLELNNHRWFADEPSSLQKRVNIKLN